MIFEVDEVAENATRWRFQPPRSRGLIYEVLCIKNLCCIMNLAYMSLLCIQIREFIE